MPAPLPPDDDLSAVPAFLRRGRNVPTLPRATTPAPAPEPIEGGHPGGRFDPAALPFPLSRRRVATFAGLLVAAWLLIAFSRQVGDASAATTRADELRAANAELRGEIALLQSDIRRVQDARYANLQSRSYGLGGRHEIAFTLEADAPPLPSDAPGTASRRVGAEPVDHTPIEAWLDLLFGVGR